MLITGVKLVLFVSTDNGLSRRVTSCARIADQLVCDNEMEQGTAKHRSLETLSLQ
jgi:hypothetical protein